MQQNPVVREATSPSHEDVASKSTPTRSTGASSRLNHITLHPVFVTILGSLFLTLLIGHFLSSSTPDSQLNARLPAAALSHLPPSQQPLSFWADKRNFVNHVFVKRAWGWTTATLVTAWVAHQVEHSLEGEEKKSGGASRSRRVVVKGLIRYVVATLGWIGVTQWFLGSPLSERVLKWTGAQCMASLGEDGSKKIVLVVDGVPSGSLVSSALCERRWGQRLSGIDLFASAAQRPYWSGGFDISGHAFLLTLSILVLLTSVSPLIALRARTLPHQIAVGAHLTLTALWWWMLFMTSIHFHGPGEKFLGMVMGMGVWWASVYTAGL